LFAKKTLALLEKGFQCGLIEVGFVVDYGFFSIIAVQV
jgi:hypothetical protein